MGNRILKGLAVISVNTEVCEVPWYLREFIGATSQILALVFMFPLQMCSTCQRKSTGSSLMWTWVGIISFTMHPMAGMGWSRCWGTTTQPWAATTGPAWSTTSSSWSGERQGAVMPEISRLIEYLSQRVRIQAVPRSRTRSVPCVCL